MKEEISKMQKVMMELLTHFYDEVYKYTIVDDRKPNHIIKIDQGEFSGKLKNNAPDGLGLLVYKNGDNYEGEFINGKREGFGVCYYSNGDCYKGK